MTDHHRRLGEPYDRFIRSEVESGAFSDPDDVLRAGLRLLEERRRKTETLRAAIQEGLDSGPAEPFDIEQFLHAMRDKAD